MTVSTELSIAAQTAISYFEDVERAIEKLNRNENHLMRDDEGNEIINGDLQLAHSEIIKSEAHEKSTLMGQYYFCIGLIKTSISVEQYKLARASTEIARNAKRNTAEAAEAFSKAITADPLPVYQYNLACTYLDLDRKSEAVQMFELVTNGNNSKLALEARKAIGRIGPVAPIKSASSSSNSDGGGFVRSQRAQWDEIIKGGIALVFGIALFKIFIGIPLAIWGIWLIAKGFIQKIDT
jgi:tetratricopeptide (TPR) repeat protein